MKNKIFDEIEIGLQETRSNLLHWVETAPEEKKLHVLGTMASASKNIYM